MSTFRYAPLLALLVACGKGGWGTGHRWDSGPDGASQEPTTPGGELEGDFLAMPPAQTDHYVFVANPNRSTLTRVAVDTLDVITTRVGADPRITRVTDDQQHVVVHNRADDSVSILDVDSLEQVVVPVRDDLNQMKLSPDSKWAALWFDREAVQPGDPPADGLQSFNEASFVDLETGTHHAMAVGFDPKDVVFTPDGSLAVVVSDAFLAIVPMDRDPLLPDLVSLSGELIPPSAEEVVLAPDGSFAFVRQFGATDVLMIDLVSQELTAIPVDANPTDLDLTPDGTKVVTVARDTGLLHVADLSDPVGTWRRVVLPDGSPYGSIAFRADGTEALLYTTASLVDRVAVWDVATDTITEHGLIKPVRTVAPAPAGSGVLVFHTQGDAPDAEPEQAFWGRWAMTMVDLEGFRTNPLLLPSEPLGYAMSDDGRFATFAMTGQPWLEVLDFHSLLHEQVPLRSNPVYVGVMPDDDPADGMDPRAWVSQDHDLGRISFYDRSLGALETITGFELNSGIE